jgi:hypothetical protein
MTSCKELNVLPRTNERLPTRSRTEALQKYKFSCLLSKTLLI